MARTHSEDIPQKVELGWHTTVEYEPVFRIGDTMLESITKMKQIEELCNEFPGLDCGSCGAPSCRAPQKISSGAKPRKTTVFTFSAITFICFFRNLPSFSHEAIVDGEDPNACIHILMHYMDKLTEEIALFDSHNLINSDTESEEGQDHDH